MAKSKSARKETAEEVARPAYTVLARRYRPQQFSDLIGQETVARALVNALESNRVAHAYLFTGARGVGKTSTARILAKALNCVKGPTPTPCGQCEICLSIASGEDMDVLEIDGASNRGIDEVRAIRQNVQFRPSRARFKIYIIDEVHMLTGQAFNALLKTLEEPPAHVKFIFATTEWREIPVTILSRCQRFDFAGIGTGRIIDHLKSIVAGEKLHAADEALELVARRAGGSMRDAQSLLDQLVAFGGERLTVDQVHHLLGTAQDDRVVALASAALERDAGKALGLLHQFLEEGLQLGELLDQLMAYWRDLMVVNSAGIEAHDLSVSSRYRDTLAGQAGALTPDAILAGLDILAAARAKLDRSSHGRVLVEMALVRLGRLEDLVSIGQLSQWLNQPGAQPVAKLPTAGQSLSALVASSPESSKKKPEPATDAAETPAGVGLTAETLPQVWQEVLAQMGGFHGRDLGKAENLAISAPNTLVIRFPARYNEAREFCQEPNRLAQTEKTLRKLAGLQWNLRIESGGDGNGAGSPQAAGSVETETHPSRYRQKRTEVVQKPLVKRAIDLLGAQIVQVDDGFGAAPEGSSPGHDESETEDL